MRAIEAKTFSGYGGLRQTELPNPQPAKDRVLVRVTAAGVTPLDYTVLSGGHPRAKTPLVLGNEGAGVIEDAGDSGLAVGSRVMFTGPYGVAENGTWQEWLLVRPEHLALVPDAIDDVADGVGHKRQMFGPRQQPFLPRAILTNTVGPGEHHAASHRETRVAGILDDTGALVAEHQRRLGSRVCTR
jgi:hypothetical protein